MKNPGIIVQIEGGGKAVAYHNEQEQQFIDLNKRYIHYLNDDYTDMIDAKTNKPKVGLKANDKLKLIGYRD